MVRFESQNQPVPAAKGSYMYDQTYTSFWDAVLQEKPGSNDRSFEKKDIKQEAVKMGPPADAGANSPTRHHSPDDEIKEEKKCADEDLIVDSSKSDSAAEVCVDESPSHSAITDTDHDGVTSSFDEEEEAEETPPRRYEAPAPEAPVGEGSGIETGEENVTTDDVRHPEKEQEEGEENSSESSVKVASEYKAEGDDSQPQNSSLVEQLKAAGKPEPEMISQLMAKIVTDAAKKELESRLQQQKEEEEQQQQEEEHATTEQVKTEPLAQIPETDLSLVEEIPLDAEGLAKAHAKLLEQAKSLAKAQALIQRQAKALALMGQQQQQQQQQAQLQHPSPSASPEQTKQTSTTRTSPPRTSPSHPKPKYGRAPSDAPSDEFCMKNSPTIEPSTISAANLAGELALPDANESVSPSKQKTISQQISELSQSAKSDTTEVTSNTANPPSLPATPREDKGGDTDLADWLSQAKSEAQKKAQELIRTVQSEAAARSQLRKEAKERAMIEEKLRLKEEAENRIKAKAVRDAWEWEQTQAAFKAEEKARLKSKAELKAAAEDKMRRKADTDAATHNVKDAQRAQLKAEAEYKLRLKADMDARWLAECKARRIKEVQARQQALERAKTAQEEKVSAARMEAERQQKIQEMAAARNRANAEQKSRLKREATEKEEDKHEGEDTKAKMEAERQRVLKEMAAAQAKANAEHKLRLKAEADAKWLAQCKARRIAEAKDKEQAIAEKKAEARVRAKMAKTGELPSDNLPPRDQGILASLPGAQSWAAARKLLLEAPKEFVPFAKSKGEEKQDSIILYLQVPGVVHVSEVKVELEDGVLYISRGIILDGVEGVQKYTRSFPFEEQLLDTHGISVSLIPANATADNVSVLCFTLPKVQSTWKIPMFLASDEEEVETAEDKDDMKDMTEVSLDAPDDEVSLVHPSDEMKDTTTDGDLEHKADATTEGKAPKKVAAKSTSLSVQDKNGTRTLTLEVPPGLVLDDISAVYGNDSIRVVGNDGPHLSFRHVVPMNSKEVQVRHLEGKYNPTKGLLIIKGLLNLGPSMSKPKSRRIKVAKMEEFQDPSGVISLFHDDVSVSSNQSHPTQSSPEHKKKGAKVLSIKSIASKYLRLKPKKHKHEVP